MERAGAVGSVALGRCSGAQEAQETAVGSLQFETPLDAHAEARAVQVWRCARGRQTRQAGSQGEACGSVRVAPGGITWGGSQGWRGPGDLGTGGLAEGSRQGDWKGGRTVGGELRKGGIRWLQESCRSAGRTGAGGAMVAVSRTWCGEPRAPQGRDCPDPRCPGTWGWLMPLLLPQPACVGCGSAAATPACSPLHPPPH